MENKKETLYLFPSRPVQPSYSFPSRGWAEPVSLFSRARVGRPREQPRPRAPLSGDADDWTPLVSLTFFSTFVTEPDATDAIESRKPRDFFS
jgi:hypothetical protein